MPLTLSPIDGAPMRQIHRYGIEFDVCPTTGGVWLDKGELDKVIALVKEETLADLQHNRSDRGRYSHDRDDDDDRYRDGRRLERRSRLADLFDF